MVNKNKECLKAEFSQWAKQLQDNMDPEVNTVIRRIEQMEAILDWACEKASTRSESDLVVIITLFPGGIYSSPGEWAPHSETVIGAASS